MEEIVNKSSMEFKPETVQAQIKHILYGMKFEDLALQPKEVKMKTLSDFDSSLILEKEKLIFIGTSCEYFLYDLTNLKFLDRLIPSNDHTASIFTL